MSRILVTGASGFVGRALCQNLVDSGHSVIATVRSPESTAVLPRGIPVFAKPLSPETNWQDALNHVETVVHLAARVHILRDSRPNPASEFRKLNVLATTRLAQQAIQAGVKRFVFLSSIGVNGNATPSDKPFTEQDPPAPHNPYSVSKLEAANDP
jgi:UDP-N-acetyl-alpha-D-quinovosamine dehydrogenase